MNLIEIYIKEIHSVKEYEKNKDCVIVDLTVDCYGIIRRQTHFATKKTMGRRNQTRLFS